MSASSSHASHFDTFDYDAEIPAHVKAYLAKKKVQLTLSLLKKLHVFSPDLCVLDAGCGTGDHLREFFRVGLRNLWGIDSSEAQVRYAREKNALIAHAISAADIRTPPFVRESFDVIYTVNTLHHLSSLTDQQRALEALVAVTKRSGFLVIHEMNIQNPLFRWYLTRIFPRIRRIDTGEELFLAPDFFSTVPGMVIRSIQYYTFIPDFTPRIVFPLAQAAERFLERSPLRFLSAHYCVVMQKQ